MSKTSASSVVDFAINGRRFVPSHAAVPIFFMMLLSMTPTYAADIQMLPPTDFSGQPCSPSTGGNPSTGGLLQWDGSTSIKCVPGVAGDSNGNLAANGTIKPGSDGIQVGNACPTEGAFAYDMISSKHQPVYCNSKLVWSALGGTVTAKICNGNDGTSDGCVAGQAIPVACSSLGNPGTFNFDQPYSAVIGIMHSVNINFDGIGWSDAYGTWRMSTNSAGWSPWSFNCASVLAITVN